MNAPFRHKSDCVSHPRKKPVGKDRDQRIWQKQAGLHNDKDYIIRRTKASVGPGKYSTKYLGDCECEIPAPTEVAMQYPGMLARDGYGWTSTDGCNIDNDTRLRLGSRITTYKGPQSLRTRLFAGGPNLSRGQHYVDVESKIRPGEPTNIGRSMNVLSGVSINRFVPMLQSLASTIQDPVHIIPEDAKDGWIRGGVSSRNLVRDNEQRCG